MEEESNSLLYSVSALGLRIMTGIVLIGSWGAAREEFGGFRGDTVSYCCCEFWHHLPVCACFSACKTPVLPVVNKRGNYRCHKASALSPPKQTDPVRDCP